MHTVTSNYKLNYLKQTFSEAIEVTEEALNIKLDEFNNCDRHKVFRGKYELEFVLKFIALIIEDSSTTKQYIQSKLIFPFGNHLKNEQAINIFSNYADTPDELKDYLQTVVR